MELQIKAIPTEKVEPLKNSVHSYVKWAKKMERLLKANPVFTKVVAAMTTKDDKKTKVVCWKCGKDVGIRSD
jgi:hypothetical protein